MVCFTYLIYLGHDLDTIWGRNFKIVRSLHTYTLNYFGMQWWKVNHKQGTTLSYATSLRQTNDMNLLFRENQTNTSFKTVVYITENFVGYMTYFVTNIY